MGVWFKTLLLFVVFDKAQLYRQLVSITCLELAKPSNQQFRLSCNDRSTYHCLLNEDSTKEFEICKTWKWIPEGNCAYLNTYGWNIDARSCSSSAELACPKLLYRSEDTIIYSACYIRNNPTTIRPLTSPFPTASNWTSSDGNGGYATSSRISDTAEKHIEMKPLVLPTILGIIVPLVSLAVIYFICMRLKYVPLYRKADPVTSEESSDREGNEDIEEQKQFLRNEMEDTSKSPTTMKDEDENLTGAMSGTCNSSADDSVEMNKSDTAHFEKNAVFSQTSIQEKHYKVSADEQGRELCTHLYNQLHTEGLKLTQEVMAATITRETGKSVKTLLTNLTDQDTRKLKEELPEESHCVLESENEHESSFFVLYGLYRIFLEIKHHPKSGWGNPIKETDVGIGDDIERFYMIHDFVHGISDPMEVPIKSYIRRLDIMLEALTRLDHDEKFKDNLTAFAKEISCFKTVLHL